MTDLVTQCIDPVADRPVLLFQWMEGRLGRVEHQADPGMNLILSLLNSQTSS
jgi:hypothetical protein